MQGDVFFLCTDHRCVVDGNSHPGIPIFFSEEGVVEPFSEYMIHVGYETRTSPGTALTYAYQLQKFINHIKSRGVDWSEVTDRVLFGWRDGMIEREGLSPSTVAAYLRAVFNFYLWAEEKGRIVGCVQIPGSAATDHGGAGPWHQISTKVAGGRRVTRLVWAGTPKREHKVNRHTPTEDEIDKLHLLASGGRTKQRDTLILSFFEELFLRRSEALGVEIGDMPEWSEIEEAERDDRPFIFTVLGKGNKTRRVSMLPELAARAREYMEGERSQAVQRARKRNPRFTEPKALFLTDTTALPLNKQYLSRRISGLMREAGIEGASGHRLRASGLTALAEAYDGFDQTGAPFIPEQVLWKVAERAGHAHPQSLKPYLDLARSRTATSGKESEIRQASRERLRRRQLPGRDRDG